MTDTEILDYLTPKKTNFTPIRLGKKFDGGYVCPKELLSEVTKCFSFGICNDISFEKDLLKENGSISIDMYDGTIRNLPGQIAATFYKQNVYFETTSKNIFANCNEKYMVKMDIEGEELNFPFINKEDLKNAILLIFELHYIQNNIDRTRMLCEFLKENGFYCFHAHGNNNRPNQYSLNNEECPEVLELTMVRGNSKEYSDNSYPLSGIDYPNNSHIRELTLGYIRTRQAIV